MKCCVKLIGIICFLVPVSELGGGVLVCQHKWEIGSSVQLTFAIDQSEFPSRCSSTDNEPFFQRSTDGSLNTRKNCTVSDISAPGVCSGSFQSGSLGCGCTTKDGNYYIVEYNFIAHPDYDGWWSAGIQCRDSSFNEILSYTDSSCDNKKAQSNNVTVLLHNLAAQVRLISDPLDNTMHTLQDLKSEATETKSISIADLSFLLAFIAAGLSIQVLVFILIKKLQGREVNTHLSPK